MVVPPLGAATVNPLASNTAKAIEASNKVVFLILSFVLLRWGAEERHRPRPVTVEHYRTARGKRIPHMDYIRHLFGAFGQ